MTHNTERKIEWRFREHKSPLQSPPSVVSWLNKTRFSMQRLQTKLSHIYVDSFQPALSNINTG